MTATLEHTLEQLFVQNSNDVATVGYDCKLIVGEDQIEIGCHRAIFQARSPVLSDIIVSQSSTAYADDASILKIYFPDDDAEAMSAIVQYCYTNTISTRQISTPQLADNLLLAVKKFGLDRDPLGILCKNILAALDVVQQSLPSSMKGKVLAVPKSHLDVTCLIDDKTFADVVIKTESENVHAHKCILLSRAPSLPSAMQLDAEVKKSVIDVSSSSRESVTRVMMFIYGGKTAAATQEEVLEDLLTAKKLHVNELVSKLERTVDISDANALNILKLAVQLDLEWLRNEALNSMSNCDYDGVFESIKCLEESCSSIMTDFEAVVRKSDNVRTRQAPQLIQGISLRGGLGIVIAASVSVLLFRIQIENEFFVAFTNVCFCCIVAFLFL